MCREEEDGEEAVQHGVKQDCSYARNDGKGTLAMHGKFIITELRRAKKKLVEPDKQC